MDKGLVRTLGIGLLALVCLLSVAQPVGAQARATVSASNRWGVIDDLPNGAGATATNRMQEAGFGWVRYTFYWNYTNPAPGVYDWSGPDRALDTINNAGLNILAQIVWPPAWTTGVSYPNGDVPFYCLSNPSHPDCNNPARIPSAEAFGEYVRQVVRRYGSRVRYLSFWNEPHNPVFWQGNLGQFATNILRAGYDAAKTVDPTINIVGPEEDVPRAMIDLLSVEGDRPFADILSFHLYDRFRNPELTLQRYDTEFKPIIDTYRRGRPVWDTESGVPSNGPDGVTLQGYSVGVLLEGLKQRRGIDKAFIYRIKDDSSADYGLLLPDDSRKPAWYSARDVMAVPYAIGDSRGDAFVYNRQSGDWTLEVNDTALQFEGKAGHWGPDWAIQAADFDGNGRSDLFLFNRQTGAWFQAINNGAANFTYYSSTWSPGWDVHILDLNGDGRSDIFLFDPTTGEWFKCTTSALGQFAYAGGRWSPGWSIYPTEWTGDGRADLFLFNRSSGEWFRATNDAGAAFAYVGGNWSPGWDIYPGDFNGDGRSDLFLFDNSSGIWFLAANNGVGFNYSGSTWSPGWRIQVAEFDGNGRADLFLYNPTTGEWFQCLSTGTSFQYVAGAWSPDWQTFITDLNADGRSDVLLYMTSSGLWYQAVNQTPGVFAYGSGSWAAGASIIASRSTTQTAIGTAPVVF